MLPEIPESWPKDPFSKTGIRFSPERGSPAGKSDCILYKQKDLTYNVIKVKVYLFKKNAQRVFREAGSREYGMPSGKAEGLKRRLVSQR